jgi:cytochrome c556
MRRWIVGSVVVMLTLLVAGMLYAEGVLKTDMRSPEQIVKARKYLMQAVKLNVGDAAKKFEAGNMADIQANGAALALMGKVMPPLYKDTHETAYSGKGKYYKGAAPADFEAAAEKFRVAAQTVRMQAEKGNKDGVAKAMGQLQQSCGACHEAYRGKY